MKKSLPNNYDISVDNMTGMTKEQESNGFELYLTTFLNRKGKEVDCAILRNDDLNAQIFSMTDGRFVLEIETFDDEGGDINYFYSTDLTDLTK